MGFLYWSARQHRRLLFCISEQISQQRVGEGKVHPRTGHYGPEGELRYSFTLSLTSALDGVCGQHQDPSVLPPGKTRYPLYRRLGRPQNRCGWVWKISPPLGFDPLTVQHVMSRHTDCAIPAHIVCRYILNSNGLLHLFNNTKLQYR